MAYHVKTSVFEGPLDLLVQLITRHQVDVAALSLGDLVAEYLSHLEAMRALDLELTSEFLLVAATLIQLKARRLLPEDVEPDLDEELALMEERDRLLSRLLVCVTFKDVAAVVAARLRAGNRFVARTAGLDEDVELRPPDVELPVTADGLMRIAERVLAPRGEDPDLDHLDLDLPSVQAALEDLRTRMADDAEATFDEMVSHCTRRVEVVAYFLALLELARWGMIDVAQDDWLSEIRVRRRAEGASDAVVSEWAP